MKSEHRHELQRNELGNLAQQAAPFFEQHGSKILSGLIALILVASGIYWWQGTAGQAETAAWTGLVTAQSSEDFATVAEKYPGTAPAAWALLNEATAHLRDGIQRSFDNRQAADTDLKLAKEKLTELVEKKNLPRELRVRALYALARCLETTSGGDVAPAIDAYKKIIAEFTDPIYSVYRENAERSIKSLESGESQDFYAWYAKQNPKPSDRPKPQDGFHGLNPGDLELPVTLPSVPDMLRESVSKIKSEADEDTEAPNGESSNDNDASAPEAPALPEDGNATDEATNDETPTE
ncbi:MAG: hypothetical protein O2955_11770 [Planctomycetota bacterium]|nr:hypothetical protein [Planctomycetota bacterium]MDA1213188.1 hypothetical protein [Planctomycetota bacterium]